MRQHWRDNWPSYVIAAVVVGGMLLIGFKNGWT